MSGEKKTILISALDWGLGHAARDIPIIYQLKYLGFNIILAGSGSSLELLKKEFPELKAYSLPSVKIKSTGNFLQFFFQMPKFLINIIKEKKSLEKLLKNETIDLILSDNRYGIYSKQIPSIILCHQIFIKLPKALKFAENLLYHFHNKLIKKFSTCLIPDYNGFLNLSGDLSHKKKLPDSFKFIGPLSRFNSAEKKSVRNDILIILSGTEPQKTILFKILFNQIKNMDKKVIFVTGNPGRYEKKEFGNIQIINHLKSKQMNEAISESEIIISRAGYSTIMDLFKLRKKAILVPTPGQTEQLYLAEYLSDKNLFIFENQKNLNIANTINKLYFLNSNFDSYPDKTDDTLIKTIKYYLQFKNLN